MLTVMDTPTPDFLMRELLPLLRQFCVGPYGIAIGGSYAKGSHDALSDVDVYLFSQQVRSGLQRNKLVVEALGETTAPVFWGCEDSFIEGGTDFSYQGCRVECWLRNTRQVEGTIASCRQGIIRREHVAWTVMGFFNYVVLADVRTMQIVEDPHGVLARWKEDVSTYPEPLRQAILRRFMAAATFWPENFHYRSAIERADRIYTSGIVQQVLYALIQVTFALNREYFPGEKKLAQVLEKLLVQPSVFSVRIQALLCPEEYLSVAKLRKQQQELCTLVTDMEQLVLNHGKTT